MIDALGNPQSVLVLGGASDIAGETLRRMSTRRLQRATLATRRPDDLDPLVADLEARNVVVERVVFDALDTASHEQLVVEAFRRSGGFDVVLAAFGVLGDQTAAEESTEEALRIVTTNFTAVATVALTSGRLLAEAGAGAFVLLSSVAGERVRRSNFVYGASKAGADALCQGLDAALTGTGARVVIVRPGFVRSKMTAHLRPAPFSADPSDVAAAIEKALAGRRTIVHVPSVLRIVFAVLRHVPTPVFRRLPLG